MISEDQRRNYTKLYNVHKLSELGKLFPLVSGKKFFTRAQLFHIIPYGIPSYEKNNCRMTFLFTLNNQWPIFYDFCVEHATRLSQPWKSQKPFGECNDLYSFMWSEAFAFDFLLKMEFFFRVVSLSDGKLLCNFTLWIIK